MNKAVLTLTCILALLFSAGTASAAFMGIEEAFPTEIPATDPVNYSVYLYGDEGDDNFSISSFRFSLGFDSIELSHNENSGANLIPDFWLANQTGDLPGLTWQATQFQGEPIILSEGDSYLIATLNFSPINPGRDGLADLWFDETPTINEVAVDYVDGADVVPVPAAVWLLGSGLLGLIGLRKRYFK